MAKKVDQEGCVKDVGRLCMPMSVDKKTGELGAPKPYRRGTTLAASENGISCAYKWHIQNRSRKGATHITFYRDGAATLAVASSVAIVSAYLF